MNEIEMLRKVADKLLEGYDCEDLWIDGLHGAALLSEAKELAQEWKVKYPSPPLHCGMPKCGVCNSQFL